METFTFDVKTPRGVAVSIEIEMDSKGWRPTYCNVDGMGRLPVIAHNICSGKTLHKSGFPLPDDESTYYSVYKLNDNGSTCNVIIAPESSHKMGDEIHALRAARKEQWKQEWLKEQEAEAQKLEAKVPGLAALQAAYEAETAYREAFRVAMEDESRDGVAMPAQPETDVAALETEFPRAALYIKAEEYSMAADDRKATAGNRAKKLLAEGGSEKDAAAILENWLPESAIWN